MKLDEKIFLKKMNYLLAGEAADALELAVLYFIQAKRRSAEEKVLDSCLKAIYWLKKAGVMFGCDLRQLKTAARLDLIEKALVVGARLSRATSRGFGLAYST